MTKPSVSFCMTPEQFRVHGLAVKIAYHILVMLTVYEEESEEFKAASLVIEKTDIGDYSAVRVRNTLDDICKEFDYGVLY